MMNAMTNDDLLTLKEAVRQYKQEERAVSNSYDWYRKRAGKSGKVWMGDINISAVKQNGIWYVNRNDFSRAINSHRESIRCVKQVTEDYENGIIHGKDGDTIKTEWGGYEIHKEFRFAWNDVERYRRRSHGMWYCNICHIPAETEHNNSECHLCSDWGGCGRDCTLSRVYCPKCGASINI